MLMHICTYNIYATSCTCITWQWDGNPLGLGLVAKDKPSEFSCISCTVFQASAHILNFQW